MMKFLLMVNKQGQTRLAQYFDFKSIEERSALEAEIIRKCLSRTEMQCSFMEHRGLKVVYRRYASLYFIVGFEEGEENELGMLEFIHALVETLDKYFENVVSFLGPLSRRRSGSGLQDASSNYPPRTFRACFSCPCSPSASWTSCSTWSGPTSSWTRW